MPLQYKEYIINIFTGQVRKYNVTMTYNEDWKRKED
jgi:hypothetical protein